MTPTQRAAALRLIDPENTMDTAEWIGEVDALLRELAAEPVQDVGGLEYRGNSVSYIHSKMMAYRMGIDEAWNAMREAGHHPDGKTRLGDAIRAALAAGPVQEPVAADYRRLIRADFEHRKLAQGYSYTALTLLPSGVYLAPDVQEAWETEKRKYAAPQQRKPLTEFRRMQIIGDEFPLALVEPIVIQKIDSVCLAIERAHGIGIKEAE